MRDFPIIIDDFLPTAAAVRERALRADFIDWHAPDGEVYRRVCIDEVPGLHAAIERVMSEPVQMLGMGYRLNFSGEVPNASIHSDLGWGTHAAVVYLTPKGEGGTAFWRHRDTGALSIDIGDAALFERVRGDWNCADRWEQVLLVEWAFGRGMVYPSRLFHSRWPFEAFGAGPEDGRLVAVAFFTPRSLLALRDAA